MVRIITFVSTLLLIAPTQMAVGMVSEAAQVAGGRLFEALASPSGKLTLSPEITIPEPIDPTAILLQANSIQTMSEKIRVQAKANTAWVAGSVTALKTFCGEQEQAMGNFPGPIPVVYCNPAADDMKSIADAGACGVLVRVLDGNEISSLEQIGEGSWADTCRSALECGVQPIPEITINDETAATWKEDDIAALVKKVSETTGSDPISVLLSVNPVSEEQEEVSLPQVPKALGKEIPILGSVRVPAGEDRMGTEIARFKEAGFTGAILRSECVPGFRVNTNMKFVGDFWSACIGELKSTKSKSFNFQSKNKMNKSIPTEWAKYQKSVIESGALGAPEDNYSPVNDAAGEYKGF